MTIVTTFHALLPLVALPPPSRYLKCASRFEIHWLLLRSCDHWSPRDRLPYRAWRCIYAPSRALTHPTHKEQRPIGQRCKKHRGSWMKWQGVPFEGTRTLTGNVCLPKREIARWRWLKKPRWSFPMMCALSSWSLTMTTLRTRSGFGIAILRIGTTSSL